MTSLLKPLLALAIVLGCAAGAVVAWQGSATAAGRETE
jgi:heme O synthase-like polyprenyltransferase